MILFKTKRDILYIKNDIKNLWKHIKSAKMEKVLFLLLFPF